MIKWANWNIIRKKIKPVNRMATKPSKTKRNYHEKQIKPYFELNKDIKEQN